MSDKASLDERTGDFLTWMAQRTSRRGLLIRLGDAAMRIAGLSIVAVVLPVDRAEAQFGCSGDWQLCNMHGNFCKACCGHGARYYPCPSCTYQGGYWEGCCGPNNCECAVIRYFDCCAPDDYEDAKACTGAQCGMTFPNPATATCPYTWASYCTNDLVFRCTIIYNTGSPCSCSNNGAGGCSA
jgi:hypothetical protein